MFPKVWAQNSVHWNPGAQEPAFLMPFPYPPSCLRTPFEFHASFNPHIHDSRKIALCPFYRLGSRGSATAHGYPPWRRVYKPTHRRGDCSVDGVEDLVNLLPEKGLGRRKSSHLPLPSPTRQSWGGRSSPWGRRETGRDCVPEGLAVPREAQWWGEFPVRKRRALHSGHVLAWQTCHFQGGNSVSGFFFCSEAWGRAGDGWQ